MFGRHMAWMVLVFLAVPAAAPAQSLTDMPLADKPLELLKDRLRIQMPAGATVQAQVADSVMASPPSADEEDRATIRVEGEKFVVVVYETFNTAGEDFQKAFAEQVSQWGKQAKVQYFAKLLNRPEDLAAGKVAGLIYRRKEIVPRGLDNEIVSGLLALPDGTVLWVRTFANATAAADPKIVDFAERVLRSASPGKRKLDSQAGRRGLWIYSKQRELSVMLPAGYVVTRITGPDFLVYNVRPLVPFGQTPGGVSVDYGSSPVYQHQRQASQGIDVKVKKIPGTLFGTPIEWHIWNQRDGDKTRTYWEALVPNVVPGDPAAVLRVFFSYTDEASLPILKAIARSMKIVPKTIPPEPAGGQ